MKGAREAPGVRPTSDLMRGALFSALEAMGAVDDRVLDLYAGTGAMGIEALSRGAGHCDFVERDRKMAAIIRQNLESTETAVRAAIRVADVQRTAGEPGGAYTLVLADPPYEDTGAWVTLADLARAGVVDEDVGTIAVEHGSREEPPGWLGRFQLLKTIRHGDSAVAIYRPSEDN